MDPNTKKRLYANRLFSFPSASPPPPYLSLRVLSLQYKYTARGLQIYPLIRLTDYLSAIVAQRNIGISTGMAEVVC